MKAMIIFLITLLALTSLALADTNVEVNIETNDTVNYNTNLNSGLESSVYINGNIANPTYVTKKSTNKDGINRVVAETITMFLGLERHQSKPDNEELMLMNGLNLLVNRIQEQIYYSTIQSLELELQAQKRINFKLQQDLDLIKQKLNITPDEYSLECIGYTTVMLENEGVNKISCNNRGETLTLYDQNGQPISVTNVN